MTIPNSRRSVRTEPDEAGYWYERPVEPPAGSPNILFVLLDDVGFADLGCYGSEIRTPRTDALAAGGLRYTNFHTTTLCSPTRACLLTGRNHHSVGMRFLANVDTGHPSGRGTVTHRAANLAEMLRDEGYSTFMVGKWHLAPIDESSAAGPFHQWPLGRGFERFYGFMDGGTDHFYPDLTRDNQRIEPPRSPEEGYHLTEDLVDEAIEMLANQTSLTPERPFFLYLAFGAGHFPHQAPPAFLERCRGRYDRGWDAVRQERFERQKAIGIVPANTTLPPRNPGVQAWDELSPEQQVVAARMQEAYAAFLEHTDEHLGRLLDYLAQIGRFDNTLVVLLSDNGASPEGGPEGAVEMIRWFNGVPNDVQENLARLDEIGGPLSFGNYPLGWAQASNTPLRWYKHNTHGGGVRDPLIVHWPERIHDGGSIREQFHHVVDLTPTVLDLLDLEAPDMYRGVPQLAIHGTSLQYTWHQPSAPTRKRTQYFEMEGHRSIWHDGWKAVTYHRQGTLYADEQWELYYVAEDFSEAHDLAVSHPEKLHELVQLWWAEAGTYGVLPLDDRDGRQLFGKPPKPGSPVDRRRFVYLPGTAHIPPQVAPPTQDVSYVIEADVEIPVGGAEGVIVAYGSTHSGYALYLKDGRLVHAYNYCGEYTLLRSAQPVPDGFITLGFRFTKTGRLRGTGTLTFDGQSVGTVEMPRTLARLSLETLRVGRSGLSPVSPDYSGAFPFTGTLRRVVYEIGDDRQAALRTPYND